MKILKRPDNIIFDTENPDNMVFNPAAQGLRHPLNQITLKTDWDFLSEHFKAKQGIKHPIFHSFSLSYYYCLEV